MGNRTKLLNLSGKSITSKNPLLTNQLEHTWGGGERGESGDEEGSSLNHLLSPPDYTRVLCLTSSRVLTRVTRSRSDRGRHFVDRTTSDPLATEVGSVYISHS